MRKKRKENVVMIADDNMFIRFLVNKFLGANARIVEIGHGLQVVDAYKEHQPDLLLLDIHLPGKNGKDILQDIMAIDPEAYVVMLSADSMRENVIYSVKTGAKAFITKPFTRDTLYKYYTQCPTITRPAEKDETRANHPTAQQVIDAALS